MKKFLLVSVLSMMFFTQSSFAAESGTSSVAPVGVWIKLLINFHRPKLDCASGFGICLVLSWGYEELGGNMASRNLCSVRGQLNDRHQLVVEINEAVLAGYDGGSALAYFKDKKSISILDSYALPDETCKALQASTLLTIVPGNYPISYENGVYTIVFQI